MSLTKVSYSMITAAPINVYDYGVKGDGTTDDTAALQAAVTAASGQQLWLGTGNFKITATINLPQRIRMTGATNRATNTIITAAFAGPALRYSSGGQTSLEMYLEHFQVFGNAPVYGAGNGIEIINGSSFNMHSCLVAGFGTNQISLNADAYGAIIRDCYVAETYGPGNSNANIFCGAEYCVFDKIESDDAKYSIYLDGGQYGNVITNGTFEGYSEAGIRVINSGNPGRTIIQSNKLNDTRGGTGIRSDFNGTTIANNSIVGSAGNIGIQLDDNSFTSIVIGNNISGAGTGLYLKNSGQNVISNNNIAALDVALDVQGGVGFPTYSQIISDNNLVVNTGGITLRHNQNNKTTYIGNTFRNAATDAYIAPTIVTGTPVIISTAGTTSEITVLSGTVSYPASTLVVAGGGGTGVVSVGAADSAGAGFRLLRIPN